MRHGFGQVFADHGLGNAHALGNFRITKTFDAVQYECGPAVGRQIIERLLQASEPLFRDDSTSRYNCDESKPQQIETAGNAGHTGVPDRSTWPPAKRVW